MRTKPDVKFNVVLRLIFFGIFMLGMFIGVTLAIVKAAKIHHCNITVKEVLFEKGDYDYDYGEDAR